MQRYTRQMTLPEVGLMGQIKLSEARIMVVGAGGLGVPVLQYLAGAGIGTIGVVDRENVELSNLHRQVLYRESDIGQPKAEVAAELINVRNSSITVVPTIARLDEENAIDLLKAYDVIVDCTDNFTARYLINDACIKLGKPLVFAAIYQFEGQLSVFNYKNGPTYRCLFPQPPLPSEVPNCAEAGVLGVLPGIMGLHQAGEVLKVILGMDEVCSGKLFCLNLKTLSSKMLSFQRNEEAVQAIKNAPLTPIRA